MYALTLLYAGLIGGKENDRLLKNVAGQLTARERAQPKLLSWARPSLACVQ